MDTTHIQSVGVIGAGTMGAGIAQVAAMAGASVRVVDVNAEVLARAESSIKSNLDRSVEKGKLTADSAAQTMSRISFAPTTSKLSDVDLVIEAVVENMDVKHRVFRELEAIVPPRAILASNTSSLSITGIAEVVSDKRRVVGLHFFNPAPLMPLVEVIAGKHSSDEAIKSSLATMRTWGKVAVLARDTPGFIVNRVARGYYLEALRLLGEGVAGIDEIDNVMRVHGGFKMGPFELMDLVGLDVNLAVSTSVWEQMGRPARLTPHAIQQRLVSENRLGRKTNRGFYAYENGAVLPAYVVDRKNFHLSPLQLDAVRAFAERASTSRMGTTEQFIFARILGAILNEAASALDAGVASSGDIDLAMLKGTNYPKGPLAWAEDIGHRTVCGVLRAMNDHTGDGRYEPSASLM